MPEKKSVVEPKATSERITLKGEKKVRVVYIGPKGGKYLRMDGKYVSLKSVMPKSGKKATRKQKGGQQCPEGQKWEVDSGSHVNVMTGIVTGGQGKCVNDPTYYTAKVTAA